MKKSSRIYIADHEGFIGAAIMRAFRARGYTNLILKSRKVLPLTDEKKVAALFRAHQPEYVVLAAQKSGGILANITQPADFIYENLAIELNVIRAAALTGTKKLLFLGASCMYPENALQPIREETFFTGAVEKTSEAYAMAKIAGVGLCKAYHAQHGLKYAVAVPATLYGPGGNFESENAHVMGALIKKFSDARHERKKKVVVWGTGKPKREFVYIDDFADACVMLMTNANAFGILNVGSGGELSIKRLAELVKQSVGFEGEIIYDATKPDGAMRKILDSRKIKKLGWRPRVPLKAGVVRTVEYYKSKK